MQVPSLPLQVPPTRQGNIQGVPSWRLPLPQDLLLLYSQGDQHQRRKDLQLLALPVQQLRVRGLGSVYKYWIPLQCTVLKYSSAKTCSPAPFKGSSRPAAAGEWLGICQGASQVLR
jgi:hypothetical protein